MAIRKAQRSKTKIKIGMSGPSGSGKSYSALKLAKGLVGSLDKVCILDTEGGSADLYSHLGDYSVLEFKAPFSPLRYIKAIDHIVAEGFELIILDSVSHEWEGEGGCLDMHQKMGGQFHNWKDVTPKHNAFLSRIVTAPVHIITTSRRKQDYVLEENSKGKMAPRKVGLKEVQRDGFEYELTLSFDINIEHFAMASKDRTDMFLGDGPVMIDEKVGIKLRQWADNELVRGEI